ncbi:MAG: cation:proton antiporter [Clostridiales bacterium]|nr:cation:proton antiporter [Candidatus Crickella merdequi]
MGVPQLIIDLAIMLMTAAVVTLVFKKLRLPLILGYIVAGFIISPYFPMFMTVASHNSIETWSEIGVVIILFHIGLEFNLQKIANIGSTAVVSAFVKMAGVMVTGYCLGLLLGLSSVDCIFLGAMLSISSTVVIQKCFEEQGIQHEKFTSLVMGSLVMEDVFGVFIMVVLSTISVSKNVSSADMMSNLALMGCYLVIWLILGIYIVPTLLNKVTDDLTDEMMTILSIGFCFLMALIANKLGFSMELGAFLAGSLLAGTKHVHDIERVTVGIKDLFGAIFFLSVGMMVDPSIIVLRWTSIIPIAIVAVIAKLIFATIGMVLSGQDLETAVKGGASLAPIGEFSFIIASLGISLGVMDAYLYPVIVSASILTIMFTPGFIKVSDKLVNFIYRIMPDRILDLIDEYTSDDQDEEEKDQDWSIVIMSFLKKTFLYGSMMLVAAIGGVRILEPALLTALEPTGAKLFASLLIYLVMAVFARPMLDFHSVNFTHLWLDRKANRLPLTVMVIFKIAVLAAIAYIPIRSFIGAAAIIPFIVVIAGILVAARTDFIQTYYLQLETRFLRNLNERTIEGEEAEFGRRRWLNEDYSIFSYFVPEDAEYIGNTIEGLDWGRRLSVYIVKIRRGPKNIVMPKPDTVIGAGDKLYIVGDEASLQTFHKTLNIGELKNLRTLKMFMDSDYEDTESALACAPIKVRGSERYVGKPIKFSGISNKARCMILGIQRDGYATSMPDANMLILKGDILWVMGSNNNVGRLASHSVGQKGVHHDAETRPKKG